MKRAKKLTMIITSIVLAVLLCVVGIIIFIKRHEDKIDYIAHRGHGYYENTEAAFYNSRSFWGIECDVWITSDNKFIVNHDSSVDFDDGSSLKISSSTYEQLLSGTIGGGYKVCAFDRYLQICKELSKIAVIEIKPDLSADAVELLIEEITNNYSTDNAVIISFSKENLLKVRAQSSISLQYLINDEVRQSMNFCIENSINPSFAWGRVDIFNVWKAHNNNLKVGVWTINNSIANAYMKFMCVDYITSDKFYK
jgi:glycerophosphoryl diester phosphodiesterase